MSKKRSTSRRAAIAPSMALAGVAAALAAAGATAYVRRRRAQPDPQRPGASQEATTWSCQCGQGFRVSGRDRHRLYWLPDAAPEDPILDDKCPSCERQLSTAQAA